MNVFFHYGMAYKMQKLNIKFFIIWILLFLVTACDENTKDRTSSNADAGAGGSSSKLMSPPTPLPSDPN